MKKRAHRWINGTKGVISLMLAALMLPFYSLAAVLIESERYQSSIRTLDEILGTSSVSVLANYDKYLHDRFGLMAVAQSPEENALSASLLSYLNKNQLTDIAGVDVDSVSVEGLYPLANLSVLRRQIEEYSKLMLPINLTIELSSIESMIKELEKLTQMGPIFKIISATADGMGSEAEVMTAVNSLEETVKATKVSVDAYHEKYKAWEKAVDELFKHLETDCPEKETDPDGYQDWMDSKEKLAKTVNEAKTAYIAAITTLIGSLDSLEKGVDAVVNAQRSRDAQVTNTIATIGSQGYQSDHQGEDAEIYKNRDKLANTMESTVKAGTGSYTSQLSKLTTQLGTDKIQAAVKKLGEERTALEAFDTDKLTGTSPKPEEKTYHTNDVDALADASAVSELVKEAEEESQSIISTIKTLVSMIKSIVSAQTFFDPTLNAKLDKDFYQQNSGGLPSEKDRSLPENRLAAASKEDEARSAEYQKAIDPSWNNGGSGSGSSGVASALKQTIDDFKLLMKYAEKLTSWRVDYFYYVYLACDTVKRLMLDLGNVVLQIGTRVAELLVEGPYRALLLEGYLVYNLPNRTNYTNGATMTGYKFSSIELAQSDSVTNYMLPSTGSRLFALLEALSTGGGYASKTFAGAELEYVLWGFNSEIVNQLMQMFSLMALRMVLDIQILANPTIAGAIAASNIASPIVAVLFVVAEGLMDTIVLVNGEKVPMLKTKPFTTPKGLTEYAKKFTKLPENLALKEKKADSSGDGGLFSGIDWTAMNYGMHSLILMMIFGDPELYLDHLTDIIQSECSANCAANSSISQKNGISAAQTFDIDKSFTVIRSQATGKMNQMLPIPNLSTDPVLGLDRVIYRGY